MKLHFIISLILFATPNQSQSWELFKNWGIYKNESELSNHLCNLLTLFPSRVNEEIINTVITELNEHSKTSNLNRSTVIKFLIDDINSKISHYQLMKKQGAKYSEGITYLGYSAAFVLAFGAFSYLDYCNDQQKKDIKDKLFSLGTVGTISGSGYASTFAPSYAHKEEIKYLLKRLAYSENNSAILPKIFSCIGALISAVAGINNLLDNKYADYYESKLCSIKQMLESKLESV